MNVAQVVLTLNFGGLEQLVIQLSQHLQRAGIRSQIIALGDGALLGDAAARGLATNALGKKPGFQFRTVLQLARLVRRDRIDLLHTHNFAPLNYGVLAGMLTGARVVNTRHGRAALSAHPWVWRLTDRVVAVSEDTRRELLKHNRIPAEKVRVILNGIDLTPYESASAENHLRRALSIPPGDALVGIVARLAPEKDHATLLRAFSVLRGAGVKAHLAVIGGGPLEADLRRLAVDLGLSGVVHFLGFRSDIAALLRDLDMFVLSSRSEGVSLTLLEAMAAGLPIAATAVGGNPEVVIDGRTGFLVPPDDPAALAAAMRRILLEPGLARGMGTAGRSRVHQVFSMEHLVRAHIDLYREVLSR